jgi:hypothetical protein
MGKEASMKFPFGHVPQFYKRRERGSYAVRDIPRYDVTSVVIYGHDPSGNVAKIKDFTFPAITMRDGDTLEITTTLDAHHGIADLSEMTEVQDQTLINNDTEYVEACQRWSDFLSPTD